jgi:hypothetical protein
VWQGEVGNLRGITSQFISLTLHLTDRAHTTSTDSSKPPSPASSGKSIRY